MLSLDGFRWDYPDLYDTPNLDQIAKNGVKAKSIIPVFPSKTFPNHYSMATGLYPDHHGLVNNTFFDPDRKDTFLISDKTKTGDGYYYKGEPIWVTAEKQGMKTASFFWVGSEAEIEGIRPGIWKKFNSSVPYTDRMDSVLAWLKLPAGKGPELITWYIEEPDGVGHKFGPESEETKKMVQQLDSIVGLFISRVSEIPGKTGIDIIITSDHGMGEIKNEKWINLYDYFKGNQLEYILGYNPMFLIQPEESSLDSVYNSLQKAEHLSVWKKDEIPPRLHYGNNDRISDLVVVADSGWSIGLRESMKNLKGGTHGYDNMNPDMHAIFYATGPSFKSDYTQESFYNIDLYPLICEILQIIPEEVDGKLSRVYNMIEK